MIRCILVFTILFLYLILGIIPYWILALIGIRHPEVRDRVSLKMVQAAFRLILFVAGAKVTVIGKENIPDDKPVLYVSNHRSYFDILVGYTNVKGLCGFVAKKEMYHFYLLRDWMKRLYCLFLDRENLKEGLKTILTGIDQIKNGISMWICPEGTRNKKDDMTPLDFKEGSLKMAEKTGCPVIPVAISGTYEIFEKQLPRMKRSKVTVTFGKPIYLNELDKETKKHAGAYTRSVIMDMLGVTEEKN